MGEYAEAKAGPGSDRVESPLDEARSRMFKGAAELDQAIEMLTEKVGPLVRRSEPEAKSLEAVGPDLDGRSDVVRFVHDHATAFATQAQRLRLLTDRLEV